MKLASLVIPLIFSVFGAVVVCLAVYKIYHKYQEELEHARHKHETHPDEL